MSLKQLSHNADIAALLVDGIELEKHGGLLIVRHVPYVNAKKKVCLGILVSELNLSNPETTSKPAHTIRFAGDPPCDENGKQIAAIYHSVSAEKIAPDIEVKHMFSNKPKEGYKDYHHKISTYVNILSGPAMAIDPTVTPYTFRKHETSEDCVFCYDDTNSARARITSLSEKFAGQRIGIIGMGGTGAYILDAVAKTPVAEIHLFDGKKFYQHNAFRSPGAASIETLTRVMNKAEMYAELYSNIHKKITAHSFYITPDNLDELKRLTFAFVAIDLPEVKKYLLAFLLKHGIPFIDVGMGLHLKKDKLVGTIRTTLGTPEKQDHLGTRISMVEDQNNDYDQNIQIVELNSLNAALAVIKWKKFIGVFADQENEYNLFYDISTSLLGNEDYSA